MEKTKYYKSIPKVDVLMELDEIKDLCVSFNREYVLESVRKVTDDLREFINRSNCHEEIVRKIDNVKEDIIREVKNFSTFSIKRVVNGTGTILHTNLGRAVISNEVAERVKNLVTCYTNLEYDLEKGVRGSRYSHLEKIITKVTGAEAAMAVNNNSAAVLLILSALAKDQEVIVSRGELVEIGGSFRIPDVMTQSGTVLVEVGTTNKTHIYDYENAINENSAALLKVHTSNYKIVGFSESVEVKELSMLAHKNNIPVVVDLGSGVLVDLRKYGLGYEPTVQDVVKAGADLVCFSGDKLLGGPQAGIIVGKKALIDKIKQHPLTRAVRIDKFTAIALESVFHEYLSEEKAIKNIPVLKLINKSDNEIKKQAEYLFEKLKPLIESKCTIEIKSCQSLIGGGSLPLESINSFCLLFKPLTISTASLERNLRHFKTPIIGRIENDCFILDLRTIMEGDIDIIIQAFKDVSVWR